MKPFRIISLCPSTTETLIDLGLEKYIVGRTIFCIHPKKVVNNIKKVGGTKNPKFDKIRELNPTHIMFNLEENDINHLNEVKSICKTIVTTPTDIDSSIEMLHIFGREFSVEKEVKQLVSSIKHKLPVKNNNSSFSYLYFIWNKPKMIVGNGTYIDSILSEFGGINKASEYSSERYFSIESLLDVKADRIFLSSEPFPFKEKHISEFKKYSECIELIDGEMVSWHGSRTLKGLNYLHQFLGV